MKKFLKKFSIVIYVFVLMNVFAVTTLALIDLTKGPNKVFWLEDAVGTDTYKYENGQKIINQKNTENVKDVGKKIRYDKFNESYTVSLSTFGFIGKVEEGSKLDMDQENKYDGLVNIDIDGNNKPDYRTEIQTIKVTVPMYAYTILAELSDNFISVLSPKIELINESPFPVKCYISEVTNDSRLPISLVQDETKINNNTFDGKDASTGQQGYQYQDDDELYMEVMSSDNKNNAFSDIGYQSLYSVYKPKVPKTTQKDLSQEENIKQIDRKEENIEKSNTTQEEKNGILLGVLGCKASDKTCTCDTKYKDEHYKGCNSSKGRYMFTAKASEAFLNKYGYDSVNEVEDLLGRRERFSLGIKYKFTKIDAI